ncbi:hypothetical protein FNV43_RR27142 [Rhamnella rubrinervis]|uniref:Uncharacterized protein n=1 Tax=Rhamnella rubrinervis TaxID=2594499 RepID=A0A8K0GKB7_9ROSA|nr:hypothetical protein FNV43_RR27142 [Rhamnella rubrinervis]
MDEMMRKKQVVGMMVVLVVVTMLLTPNFVSCSAISENMNGPPQLNHRRHHHHDLQYPHVHKKIIEGGVVRPADPRNCYGAICDIFQVVAGLSCEGGCACVPCWVLLGICVGNCCSPSMSP